MIAAYIMAEWQHVMWTVLLIVMIPSLQLPWALRRMFSFFHLVVLVWSAATLLIWFIVLNLNFIWWLLCQSCVCNSFHCPQVDETNLCRLLRKWWNSGYRTLKSGFLHNNFILPQNRTSIKAQRNCIYLLHFAGIFWNWFYEKECSDFIFCHYNVFA